MTSTEPQRYDDRVKMYSDMPKTEAQIRARIEGQPQPKPKEPIKYLGRTEVALYLGLAGLPSLTGVELPPPDAVIGDRKGWTEATIDEWNANRPGRGRWGPRDDGFDY